mmetsp:Transcript_43676/g.116736  ORF Transcript_43676/g.116736 Transcript_43676/m.116736 type:complete len:191 (+) Transcript_43676:150-722(+)
MRTMPSLHNFRKGTVKNYCRVFNLVSIINLRKGFAVEPYLATCTAERRVGSNLQVVAFEVPVSEYEAFAKREARLRHETVEFEDEHGSVKPAVMCTSYSDVEYFEERCGGDKDMYFSEVGQYYSGKLYRTDIFPVPRYLALVLRAHESLGADYADNFLDSSFLADGATSLRAYLQTETFREAGARTSPTG